MTLRKTVLEAGLRLTGRTLDHLQNLERWQWHSPAEARVLQERRLLSLLEHAYAHTPHYRELFQRAGVVSRTGSVSLKEFVQIPILGKHVLRDSAKLLLSDDIEKRDAYPYASGATTGEPVTVMLDRSFLEWSRAKKLLFDRWSDCELGDLKAILWGADRDWIKGSRQSIASRFRHWAKNELWLRARQMRPDNMNQYLDLLSAKKPAQLLGFAEAVYELAGYCKQTRGTIDGPRSVMTSAGTLLPHMRATIESAFGVGVYDRYGCREVSDIACECSEHRGLHVSTPTHVVEIVRDNGQPAEPGEVGHVLVTSLVNYAMPIIRYRLGDMAAWHEEPCPCGRSWPLLKEVAGRITDYFVRVDGTRVRMNGLWLANKKWIRRYQIIQEAYKDLRVLIVKADPSLDDSACLSELEDVTDKLKAVMGAECTVRYEFVDHIEPTPSGKTRFVISKVAEKQDP